METSQRVVVGVVFAVGLLAVGAIGFASGVAAQETNATDDGEASFGAQVSAFMQSSASDANGTVERGMWNETVTDASEPGAAVSERARDLEQRLDGLEARSDELEAVSNDSGPASVVYTARASAVRAELANLRQSVNQTAETAAQHDVDGERLADLRQRAGNASGPEVAATARNLTGGGGGPPEWVPGGPDRTPGPPADVPGAGPGNETGEGGPGDGGPPDDRGNDSPGDGGAPGDSGAPDGDSGNANPGDGGAPGDGGSPSGGGGSGTGGGGGSGNSGGGGSGNSGGGGSGNSGGGGSSGSGGPP